MHILFSLPVHENNDIVRLTIANVQQHVNNCTIILHVSANFNDFDWSIGSLPGVSINSERFPTVHGHSQFGIHLSNHAHAISCGINYDAFCILHTSEMFVRSGLEHLIAQHPYALWYTRETMPRDPNWWPMRHATANRLFDDTVPDRSWYIGSLLEGMWIHRDIMQQIFSWTIQRPALFASNIGWTLEEIALPTLTNWFGKEQPCGSPYNAFFDKKLIEISDVDAVLAGLPVELWALNCWNTAGPPNLTDSNTIFSVKRLARDLDDPVRKHIIQLTGLDLGAILRG